MAIYHFSGTVISRSQGRSAVACAAYRSGEKLHDERYGKDHDYTQKQDVAHTEILLPDGAPLWMADREKLWNAVELHEKRKDAQLAREFNFALPRELTLKQNVSLACEFVQETFVKQGMIADLCIHNDKSPDGQLHPHAHVMLTMREVNGDGFGPKVRSWNDKALLLSWREEWALSVNHHLGLHGHDLKIDHRSLEEQGIQLEPQHKIGAAVARDRLVRMEDHLRIARENGEKLLANPAIALHAITQQQSTFTQQDVARFVNRHTVDAQQFSLVYTQVKSCAEMVALGLDDKGRARFTTQEMLALESRMIARSTELAEANSHAVNETLQLKAQSLKSLTTEQKIAFDHVVGAGGLKCVVGFAGTGKSYLLGAARDVWEGQGYQVHGVTLSGIAAENLSGSSGITSRTFASRSYYWDKGEQSLTSKDILVVDEAGMLSSRQMTKLMDQAHAGGAKVVLVGDPQQLQAIEAGAAFRAISERVHYVELTDIRRQRDDWQREATKELALGKTGAALERYAKHTHLHEFETSAHARTALVEVWNDARVAQPEKTQIMLAYNRSDVLELNQLARSLRSIRGELGKDVTFQMERGERVFAEQDRVYFLKNDRALGVMNGTLGTIEAINDNKLTIRLDGDLNQSNTQPNTLAGKVTVMTDQYNHLDHGYAATIHRAQGVTVDRSYVLASRYLDAHSSYVAMSRHRESADLFYGRDVFLMRDDLVRSLSRDRAKDISLDYTQEKNHKQEFAEMRGVFVEEKFSSSIQENVIAPSKTLSSEEVRLMRQTKLREFTESIKLERASRDASHDAYDRPLERERSPIGNQRHRDLTEFKRQFEEKNPEHAKQLRHDLLPAHEKKALSLIAEFKRLEQMVQNKDRTSSLAKNHLEKLVNTMSKQKDVMHFLKSNHEPLSKQINQMAKEFQQDRGLDLER